MGVSCFFVVPVGVSCCDTQRIAASLQASWHLPSGSRVLWHIQKDKGIYYLHPINPTCLALHPMWMFLAMGSYWSYAGRHRDLTCGWHQPHSEWRQQESHLLMMSFDACKDEENAKAIKLLEHVVDTADAIKDDGERIEHLVKGVFSGNIFDLGAAQVSSTPCCLVSGWWTLYQYN